MSTATIAQVYPSLSSEFDQHDFERPPASPLYGTSSLESPRMQHSLSDRHMLKLNGEATIYVYHLLFSLCQKIAVAAMFACRPLFLVEGTAPLSLVW